jgi:putative PIN family toxin of toxin-antitoxin system
MIAAVFDCMVHLQAATNRLGAAGACLAMVETGHVKLFISPAILDEVRDVLGRPAIRKAFPKLTDAQVEEFIERVREMAHTVETVPAAHRVPRDPDDEPYVNLAATVHADFLVSRDKDLLSLMDDDAFRQACPGLTIIEPGAFLVQVRARIAEDPRTKP